MSEAALHDLFAAGLLQPEAGSEVYDGSNEA